jgi:hypothetical protein
MVSIFEKEPVFFQERHWSDTTKLPDKFKFSGKAGKAEVHIDSGSIGLEFYYEKTIPDFMHAGTILDWSWEETFSEFEGVTKLPGARCWQTTPPIWMLSTSKTIIGSTMTKLAFVEPLDFLSAKFLTVRCREICSTSTWCQEATIRS